MLYDQATYSRGDIFIVGESGKILKNFENTIDQLKSGTSKTLLDIWGCSLDDIYAVGKSNTILRIRPRNISNNRPPEKPIAQSPLHEAILPFSDSIELVSSSFKDLDRYDTHQMHCFNKLI